jgi:hypothetical protein
MALSEIPEPYKGYSLKCIWPSLKLAENLHATAHSFVLLPKKELLGGLVSEVYIIDNMLYCTKCTENEILCGD